MITVCIPAYNEEKQIRAAALAVLQAAEETGVSLIEVIIVNDGSSDGTAGEIARLEKEFPSVHSISHPQNKGLGASFIDAIQAAKYGKICLFPGDNTISLYTIKNVLKNRDKADIVIGYYNNNELRSLGRHAMSIIFNLIYCSTFNVHARYLQGSPCLPTERVRTLDLVATEYSLLAEIQIKLMRSGASFIEVDGYFNPGYDRKSVALRRKTVINTLYAYFRLVYEVFIRHPLRYRHKPVRVLPPP